MNKVAKAYLFYVGIFTICSLLALFLLLSLLITWKRSQPLHHMSSLVSSIQKNHSSPFITHLAISVTDCPQDYIPLLSSLKTSPVKTHCKCQTSRVELSGDACPSDCTLVPASPGLPLLKIEGLELCAKTYPYADFVHSSDGECPANHHLCGRDSRYFLCFPQTRKCPLNHLFLSANPLILDSSYSTIFLSEGLRLYFSNSQQEFPLVTTDFQLAYNKQVCIDPSQVLRPALHFHFWTFDVFYPEDGCPTKISSSLSYLDSRYVFLSSQSFKGLLNSNGLEQYSASHGLDIFDFFRDSDQDFDVDIMFRPRIYYNPDCLVPGKNPATSLFTLSENSNSEEIQDTVIACFFMLVFTGFLGFVGIILKKFCSRKRNRRKMMTWILTGVMVLFTLTLVPVVILLRRVDQVDHSFFRSKMDADIVCGDRFVKAIIEGIVYNYNETRSIAIAVVVFIVLASGSWVVILVIKLITNEDEHEVRTVSDREHSKRTVYVMGTIPENERYTNDREGSTKENALELDGDDTWHKHRVVSYIPKNIYIDEQELNSFDSELAYKPAKSRVLGVSQAISKGYKRDMDEEYYNRKQKRRRNAKLQKRLEKQKGFEMINTINSKSTQNKGESLMDQREREDSHIKAPIDAEKYQTITIMSPNLSMDESQIIQTKVNQRQMSPEREPPKKPKLDSENEVVPQKSRRNHIERNLVESSEVASSKKESAKNNPLFDNNEVESEEVKAPNNNRDNKMFESITMFKNKNRPKRTRAKPTGRKPARSRTKRSRNDTKTSTDTNQSNLLSRISQKVKKPEVNHSEDDHEPEEVSKMGKRPESSLMGSRRPKTRGEQEKSKGIRRSRKSRYEKSVHSSSSSNQESGLLFGNKQMKRKTRDKQNAGEKVSRKSRQSRKSRNPQNKGSLFSKDKN